VCADTRCSTLLGPDAEICDECGGTLLEPLERIGVSLCGWAGERPVVFRLPTDRPSIIGRSARGGPQPDIDLRRFPDSGVVHRRHAWIELDNGEWQVTHLGTNTLVVSGRESVLLEPGATVRIRSGDSLQVGGVVLQLATRPESRSAARI
jgi:hypothetical protein